MSQYLFRKGWTARSGILHFAFCILNSAFFLTMSSAGWAGSNLAVNGHFSDTNEFLHGWKYNYEDTGNELLAANHTYVSVTNEGSRKHVLALRANNALLGCQGVQVDSDPIPVASGGRYTLTISAKTTGPDCRILVEGYFWRPGIKPHANPKLKEVRKCYRFTQVYFGAEKTGSMGGISPSLGWSNASQTFPDEKMTKLAREKYDKIQFLVIHIIAIGGSGKDPEWVHLYVDDVELERINK
jgi:hypothetical protein